MNDKQKDDLIFAAIAIFFTWTILLVGTLCTGCSSTGKLTNDDDIGREAIYTLGQLEEKLESLDRRVEDIARRAEDVEGEVDIIEKLFREYVGCVQQMRTELNKYRTRVETN